MSTSYSTDLFTLFFQKPVYLKDNVLMHFTPLNPTELEKIELEMLFPILGNTEFFTKL